MVRQIEAIRERFAEYTVSVDAQVASLSGRLRADVQNRGQELKAIDALIGACAMHVAARLATRNLKHFQLLDLELVNPWTQ